MDEKKPKYGPVRGVGVLTDEGYVDAKEYLDSQYTASKSTKDIDLIHEHGVSLVCFSHQYSIDERRDIILSIRKAQTEIDQKRQMDEVDYTSCRVRSILRDLSYLRACYACSTLVLLSGMAYLIFR